MTSVKYVLSTILAMVTMVGLSGVVSAQGAITEETLVGTWNADFAATLATLTPEQQAALAGLEAATATMTFGADHMGSYHGQMGDQVEDHSGAWSLDVTTGTVTVIDTATAEVETFTVAAVDADTLVMTGDEGVGMIWHRAGAEGGEEAAE